MRIRGGAAIPHFGVRPFVCVAVFDERMSLGVGEATPWPASSELDIGEISSAILDASTRLGEIDLERYAPLEAIRRACERAQKLIAAWKPAQFALETAMLDLVAQRQEQSVAKCLTSNERAEIPCNALLDAATDDLPARALELKAQGYSAIKVKLRSRDSAGFERELDALRELRQVWPGELRLDPNGSWTLDEAREKLRKLAEFEPRYVEQPVAAELLGELGQTAVPCAADESLLVPGLPERLAQSGTCAAFILKPALLGGLTVALELAKLAESAGIAIVTTHALDGPVAVAAATEFAFALPGEPLASGLDLHPGLSRYPKLSSPHHARAGLATRAVRPGLGFTEEERKRWAQMA